MLPRSDNETIIWLLLLALQSGCATTSKPSCPLLEVTDKPAQPELLVSPTPSVESSMPSEKLPTSLKNLTNRMDALRRKIESSPGK